jgi:hypothetical protein
MVLTVKKYLKYILYKKYDHSILNKFKYIISVQKVVTTLFPAAAYWNLQHCWMRPFTG